MRKSLPYRTVQRERERRRPAECRLLTPIMVGDNGANDLWTFTDFISKFCRDQASKIIRIGEKNVTVEVNSAADSREGWTNRHRTQMS